MITTEDAINIFKSAGGVLRTKEAIEMGINQKTLHAMKKSGKIVVLSRGVCCLVDDDMSLEHIDLIVISKRLPRGVICLISALSFHNLTTQIPHDVYVAYQQGWRQPKIERPLISIVRYSKASYEEGIEEHVFNGTKVRIYSAAKTVADCFKFRNKVGLDVAIESLKDYWHKYKDANMNELIKYAKVCGVEKVMSPYIEAIIHE
jgi:predicted transcriptional regulator of viral defense system